MDESNSDNQELPGSGVFARKRREREEREHGLTPAPAAIREATMPSPTTPSPLPAPDPIPDPVEPPSPIPAPDPIPDPAPTPPSPVPNPAPIPEPVTIATPEPAPAVEEPAAALEAAWAASVPQEAPAAESELGPVIDPAPPAALQPEPIREPEPDPADLAEPAPEVEPDIEPEPVIPSVEETAVLTAVTEHEADVEIEPTSKTKDTKPKKVKKEKAAKEPKQKRPVRRMPALLSSIIAGAGAGATLMGLIAVFRRWGGQVDSVNALQLLGAFVASMVAGAVLLLLGRITHRAAIAFLGSGVIAVIMMFFPSDQYQTLWGGVGIVVATAITYALAHAISHEATGDR